ncbi:MAG: TonB-dependent receptor [Sphingosinicella sp.]|nr:TonB-dependent receptor [Sphingosinicella sp.]
MDSPIRGAEARMAADLPLAGGTARGNLSLTHQDYRTHEAIAFVEGGMSGLNARTDDRIRTNSGEIGGEWSRAFGGLNTKLLMLATRKDIAVRSASDDGGTPSDYVSDSVADERILRVTADRTPERGAAWEISTELAYNALESKSALSMAGAPVALPGGNVTITEWRGDASAQVKVPVFNRLSAEMMIRGEASRLEQEDHASGFVYSRDFGFLKPKVLLRWSPGTRGQVRLRAEREVGQLDFSDFASSASLLEGTVDAGNVDLRPQTSWVFEADVERRFGADGALTLALRHERIDNVLDLRPVEGFDAPGNIGRGKINAASVQFTWPLDSVGIAGGRVSFSGEWRHSRVRDPVTGNRRSITALAPFEGEIHASLDRPAIRSTFALDVYFGQKLTYRRINEVRQTLAEPYASLKWTFNATPRVTIETSVQNILSRKHDRDRFVYAGPRGTDDIQFEENRWYRSRTGAFISIRYQH